MMFFSPIKSINNIDEAGTHGYYFIFIHPNFQLLFNGACVLFLHKKMNKLRTIHRSGNRTEPQTGIACDLLCFVRSNDSMHDCLMFLPAASSFNPIYPLSFFPFSIPPSYNETSKAYLAAFFVFK